MKTEQIAKLCYEVNRAICEADPDDLKSQVPWDVESAEVKAGVRDGVIEQLETPTNLEPCQLKDYVFLAIVNTCKTFPVE